MKIRITIVEDSPEEKERLIAALHQWESARNVVLDIEHYYSGENYFASHTTDKSTLYILDIQLRGMDGIEVAKRMRARGFNGTLLFLTAFREYVFEGYDVRALQYLLKPVEQEALNRCLDDVYQQLQDVNFIYRDTGSAVVQVPYRDIIYFTVHNHYVDIITTTEVISCRLSLRNILPLLPLDFIQCHRGYIVNMRHIRKISGTLLSMSNNAAIDIGRNYLDSFRHDYANFSMRLDVPYRTRSPQ